MSVVKVYYINAAVLLLAITAAWNEVVHAQLGLGGLLGSASGNGGVTVGGGSASGSGSGSVSTSGLGGLVGGLTGTLTGDLPAVGGATGTVGGLTGTVTSAVQPGSSGGTGGATALVGGLLPTVTDTVSGIVGVATEGGLTNGVQGTVNTVVNGVGQQLGAGNLINTPYSTANPTRNPVKDELVYIWTGDDDRKHPDFIAIYNFNRSSPDYGKLVKKVDLKGASRFGNEPHHLTFSTDYYRVAGAGILSFLYPFGGKIPLQDQVFIFDTTDPRNPIQINTANPLLSGAADELYPVKETGGFLLSSLSTRAGTAFGRLTELDRDGRILLEYPLLPPLSTTNPLSLDGLLAGTSIPIRTDSLVDNLGILSLDKLNIHGIAVREDLNLLVTTDFIEPASALVATQLLYGGIRFQNTFRKWDYKARRIVDTWVVDEKSGNLVTHYIPGDEKGRFYGTGVNAAKIYLLDPDLDGSHGGVFWSVALDLNKLGLGGSDPHYFVLGADQRTGFVTLNKADKIIYFDYSTPESIKVVSTYSLPKNSNPHYIAFYPGGLGGTQSPLDDRFILINYFLDFVGFGIIRRGGSKTVQVFQWNDTDIFPDPKFKTLDFKTAFPESGVARPHGTTYYHPYDFDVVY